MRLTCRSSWLGVLFLLTAHGFLPTCHAQELPKRIVIDSNFPGAYQVEVADVNGDKKPDIIAVGGSACAWYENPGWKKRFVSSSKETPGIISSATTDLDGDGKAEIAIAYEFGMNTPTEGKLTLAKQGTGLGDPWIFTTIGNIGSIHRLRWGNVDGRYGLELVIAPLFGREAKPPTYQEAAAAIRLYPAHRVKPNGELISEKICSFTVLHAIEVIDVNGDGRADILAADNQGVQLIIFKSNDAQTCQIDALIAGAPGDPPRRGCSEVHLGHTKGAALHRDRRALARHSGGRLYRTATVFIEIWSANRDRRHPGRWPRAVGR